jgi:CAAX protease family protein
LSFIPNPQPEGEIPSSPLVTPEAGAQPAENPAWTGWDVVWVSLLFVVAVNAFLGLAIAIAVAHHVDGVTAEQIGKNRAGIQVLLRDVRLVLPAQLVAYAVSLAFMWALIVRRSRRAFFASIRWNWPESNWAAFVAGGAVLAIAVDSLSRFLPIPRSLPIEDLFQGPAAAYAMAAFGILVAPMMEELFFRGLLYPVLARTMGMMGGILTTAAGFMLVHASQLGNAWAPLLIMFVVGVVLTTVRGLTKSVAASVLLHAGYNGAIFGMMFVATRGFHDWKKVIH